MTKTNVQSTPSNPQHHDTPNNKTHVIKFRVTAEEKLISPLIVWGNTLVDGHNRYEIVQEHPEISFSTMPLPFESREEVLAWICKNQLGRRNLTPEQKKFLMGKQYSSEKRTEAFRGNQHTAKKSGSVQSEHNQKPMKTCERIAQENHSSASSVRRAEYYAHGVDVADELSPGFRDRFFREELHIPDYLLENLGKAKPEEQAEIFEEIKNYVPKPKKVKPNKVTVKQAEKAASTTRRKNLSTLRSCCRPMRRPDMQTGRPSGTPWKPWRTSGTPSLPGASCWRSRWKSRKSSTFP